MKISGVEFPSVKSADALTAKQSAGYLDEHIVAGPDPAVRRALFGMAASKPWLLLQGPSSRLSRGATAGD